MDALSSAYRVLHATWRPLATGIVLIGIAEAAKRANLLPVFVPAPSEVLLEIWNNPRLVISNLAPTAWKATAGYLIAAVIAITAGALAVSLRALYGTIYNVSVMINSVPIIATAPLLALWLGQDHRYKLRLRHLRASFRCWSEPCKACRPPTGASAN